MIFSQCDTVSNQDQETFALRKIQKTKQENHYHTLP